MSLHLKLENDNVKWSLFVYSEGNENVFLFPEKNKKFESNENEHFRDFDLKNTYTSVKKKTVENKSAHSYIFIDRYLIKPIIKVAGNKKR